MAEENEKFCPTCKKQELRYENGHYECTDCGNVSTIVDRAKPFSISKVLFLLKLCLRIPYILIYLAPTIVYFLILLATCYFMLSETWNLLFVEPSNGSFVKTTDQILGTFILFILISMALMELTSLISEQYLDPAAEFILRAYEFETFDVPTPKYSASQLASNDKRYTTKVLTLAVIFIVMHIFYEFFTGKDSMAYAVLIVGSLLGCAVILIAIRFNRN
jgi:hypothetical protein